MIRPLTVMAVMAATPLVAEDVTEDEKTRLRTAMATVGCTVNTEELRVRVMEEVGVDERRMGIVAGTMAMADEFVDVPGGIKLVTGPCS
ncbi:hypothetical protein [Actibacterium sp. 188UL27-1]|uniref:hypothetical protein n=1 Tax=Actibacterium sp. 188UL27-1 TaxID=2786961 RepID=UPI00195DEC3D|nr:hypothetical protein [Actibacterium sp. 188UL27-1]MBM7067761.1 hypothetical protein [Actibacterium sp. 188UL27-1]